MLDRKKKENFKVRENSRDLEAEKIMLK